MSGVLAPQWLIQALTDAGAVASGAKLYSYIAGGGNVPSPVYADKALTTPLANPYEFNSAGRGSFWLDPLVSYRLRLETATGVLLDERDEVDALGAGDALNEIDARLDALEFEAVEGGVQDASSSDRYQMILFGSSSTAYCTNSGTVPTSERHNQYWFAAQATHGAGFSLLRNYGVGGYVTSQIADAVDTYAAASPARYAVFQPGANDLGNGSTFASFEADCDRGLEGLLGASKTVVILTPWTRSSGTPDHSQYQALVAWADAAAERYLGRVYVVNGYGRFSPDGQDTPAEYLADDRHLNATGAYYLAEAWDAVYASIFGAAYRPDILAVGSPLPAAHTPPTLTGLDAVVTTGDPDELGNPTTRVTATADGGSAYVDIAGLEQGDVFRLYVDYVVRAGTDPAGARAVSQGGTIAYQLGAANALSGRAPTGTHLRAMSPKLVVTSNMASNYLRVSIVAGDSGSIVDVVSMGIAMVQGTGEVPVSGPSGTTRQVKFQTNGSDRAAIGIQGSAADIFIDCYDNTGTFLFRVLDIDRLDGDAVLASRSLRLEGSVSTGETFFEAIQNGTNSAGIAFEDSAGNRRGSLHFRSTDTLRLGAWTNAATFLDAVVDLDLRANGIWTWGRNQMRSGTLGQTLYDGFQTSGADRIRRGYDNSTGNGLAYIEGWNSGALVGRWWTLDRLTGEQNIVRSGTTEVVNGCIYSQWGTVTQSGVKANASLASASSIGSRTIGAGRMNYVGACVDIQASGFLTTDASPGTGAMRVTIGGVTFRDITFTAPTSVTNVPWTLRGRIMVRVSGGSSQLHGVMVFEYTDAAGVVQRPKATSAAHVTGVDLAIANAIDIDWTASDAGTSLVVTDIEFQVVR